MAYTDTATLKRYLGIAETADDTLLGELIATAKLIIDARTGRTFEASEDVERTFDTERDVDGLTLYLDKDLCSITSITNGDGTTITAAQYVTEPRNQTPYYAIKLLASTGLYWDVDSNGDSENAITIDGKWAYSATAAACTEADIPGACKRLAAYLYRQKDNAGELDRPIFVSNATILPAQIPRDIEIMLDPVIRRVL